MKFIPVTKWQCKWLVLVTGLAFGSSNRMNAADNLSDKMLLAQGPLGGDGPRGDGGLGGGGIGGKPKGLGSAPAGNQNLRPSLKLGGDTDEDSGSAPNNPNGTGNRPGSGPPGLQGQNAIKARLVQGGGPNPYASKFPAGSPLIAISGFCTAIEDGDTATASDYLSPKAKGNLGQMREGELSEEKIEEITAIISPISELKPASDPNNQTKQVFRNGKGQSITFHLRKEKDSTFVRISELTYTKVKNVGGSPNSRPGSKSD